MDILQEGRIIGQAQVWKEGLYYCFDCWCQPIGMCRLAADTDGKYENLGIPIPGSGGLRLRTKIPAKRLTMDGVRIVALPISQNQAGEFVPVFTDQPFGYLSRLQNGCLVIRSNQPGIMLKEESAGRKNDLP